MTSPPDAALLRTHGLRGPVHVAGTRIADVWKAWNAKGTPVALKIYKDRDSKNEAPGFAFLQALRGRGAARVHTYADGVAAMEWLEGPSLGDLARAGDDAGTARTIAEVAKTLHTASAPLSLSLDSTEAECEALRTLSPPPEIDPALRHAINRCQTLLTELLASTPTPIPLHGDLHHDNIIVTPRGPLAFDAKGILGEPAFEFANTFPNPVNMGEAVFNPARARMLAEIWGQAMNLSPTRLLQWGAVRAALSYAWGGAYAIVSTERMIHTMLTALDQVERKL